MDTSFAFGVGVGKGDAGDPSPAVVNPVLGAGGKYVVLNTISVGVLQFWLWFNFGCFSYIGGWRSKSEN